MSFTKKYPYNDTSGAGTKTLVLSDLNLAADFVIESQESDQVKLISLRSPMDCPETIRLSCHNVANIYNNASITATGQHPIKNGVKLVSSDKTVIELVDETNNLVYYGPISCTISVTVPCWEQIDSRDVLTIIQRTAAALYNTDDAATGADKTVPGIERKLRGAEVPKGVS